MKKSLVTGGAGFIGSHLVDYLLQEPNRKVIVLDNFSSGRLENLTTAAAMTGKKDPKRVEVVQGTIEDPGTVLKCASDCDEIYHMAAVVGVKRIIKEPFRSAYINVVGAMQAISAAETHGCRLFLASTSQVYGINPGKCKEDDYIKLGHSVVWSYAAAKALTEYLALAAHKVYRVPVVVGRYFNVFGPRQDDVSHVLPRFVEWALRDKAIQIYGDGNQIRSYTWVKDAIHATVRLLREPKANGKIFNIGSSRYTSIDVLAKMVKINLKSKSKIVYVPYDKAYHRGYDDVWIRTPDITAMRETIGFTPKTDLPYIIAETAKHIRKKIQMEEIEKKESIKGGKND